MRLPWASRVLIQCLMSLNEETTEDREEPREDRQRVGRGGVTRNCRTQEGSHRLSEGTWPCDALISDLWPPDLGESTSAASAPVRGTVFRQPQKTTRVTLIFTTTLGGSDHYSPRVCFLAFYPVGCLLVLGVWSRGSYLLHLEMDLSRLREAQCSVLSAPCSVLSAPCIVPSALCIVPSALCSVLCA